MERLAGTLRGGDRRSIGQADVVVAVVRRQPARFAELWDCLRHDEPLVRMRAADALEKLSRDDRDTLAPYKDVLLARSLDDGTAEMRWHLVAMISRLPLDADEAKGAVSYLDDLLRHDPSRIVRVTALQAAADICSTHPALKDVFRDMLDRARASKSPSVKARARKIASDP